MVVAAARVILALSACGAVMASPTPAPTMLPGYINSGGLGYCCRDAEGDGGDPRVSDRENLASCAALCSAEPDCTGIEYIGVGSGRWVYQRSVCC